MVVAAAGVLAAHRAAVAPTGDRVVVAIRDIDAGTVVTADDLGAAAIDLPTGVVAIPADDVDEVIGAVVRHDVAEGDLLRGSDLADADASAPSGSMVVPVEVDRGRALTGSIHTGSQVDVLATDPDGSGTAVLASGVTVVDVDTVDDDGLGASDTLGVRLAIPTREVATAVVDASVRSQLTLVAPTDLPTSSDVSEGADGRG